MTQLDAELQEAIWADYRGSAAEGSSGGEEASDDAGDFRPEDIASAGPGIGVEEMPDLDDLVETLQGLPVEDAVEEIRDALKKAGKGASDADLLGILLRVFRFARDSALEGYESWDTPVSYCDELTRLCDKNFVGIAGGGAPAPSDFPPNFVAAIYAECGRTLLLASELRKAYLLLEKAVNVFSIIPDGGDALIQRQAAAARASFARVTRRLEGAEEAQVHYLKALEIYARLSAGDDTAEFLSEFCEVIGEGDADSLSPSTLGLVGELAEEKFGTGSEEHLGILRQIADVCIDAGCTEMAAPALACRARAMRDSCVEYGGFTSKRDALAAAEEAAGALEAALPARLGKGDLEGAIAVWTEAITFREFQQGPDSEVVRSMHTALEALVHALGGRAQSEPSTADESESHGVRSFVAVADTVDEEDEAEEEAEVSPPPAERWDDEPEEQQAEQAAAFSPPPRVTSLSSAAGPGLRPGWMPPPRAKASADSDTGPKAAAAPTVDDAWD